MRTTRLRLVALFLVACAVASLAGVASAPAHASGPGNITTIAGAGVAVDGPAADVKLENPSGVAVDGEDNLYVTDFSQCIVGKISNGRFTTVAGKRDCGFSGDGGPATSAGLNPVAIAVDARGHLYITDFVNCRLRKVAGGAITTIAGNGTCGGEGDGGPAMAANFAHSVGVAVSSDGTVYIADKDNCRLRQVKSDAITTVAGTIACGDAGDGGPAVDANLDHPAGVMAAGDGTLYIADAGNCRVRVVRDGIITTIAGNGACGFSGDGGRATEATLNGPYALAMDALGGVIIADRQNCRIRRVSDGIITTIAGNGTCGFSGDGGPATDASLNLPDGVAVDSIGNLYISDHGNHRIRKVEAAVANAGGIEPSPDGGNRMWMWTAIGAGGIALIAVAIGIVSIRRRGANAS